MITGQQFRDAFLSGANNIANHRQEVDALNVFPVPDGDTGTNMSMSSEAAMRELQRLPDSAAISQAADICASALLRGARGNSGVILSLLFRGFSVGLKGRKEATPAQLAGALEKGVEYAYKAVMKPTEGTILTVARTAAEQARESLTQKDDDPAFLLRTALEGAQEALARTPDQLPVLKKAGVVDAGGQGFVYILEGMVSVLEGRGKIQLLSQKEPANSPFGAEGTDLAEAGEKITFTYCTEFLVLCEEASAHYGELRAYLEGIGDSAVTVADGSIIKCHVHTDNPGNALQKGLEYGQLTGIKIENMREQYEKRRAAMEDQPKSSQAFPYMPVDPSQNYGFVAVAAGEGIQTLFTDLGVTHIVSGGQTMNPSTDDILSAIHGVPAKNVFVLPNNKNIIMAAEQAAKLADRGGMVLPTRTIPQGLSAMLAFDEDATPRENLLAMQKAFERVGTGLITFAARDSDFDGHKIKSGELLALENGKLSFTGHDLSHMAVKLTRSLLQKDSSVVTLLYGQEVTEEQASAVEAAVTAKIPNNIELVLVNGGQPIYSFIISVE